MMSEYIHISNLCCIGGLCESFIFADIFQKRYKSPTDSMTAKNFKSLLDLFNGNLFNAISNDDILCIKDSPYRKYYASEKSFLQTHDDFKIRYYCDTNNGWSWYSGHIDFTLPNRKEEFHKRVNDFNNFAKLVQEESGNYYLYAISPYDCKLNYREVIRVADQLPDYVRDNLIILGSNRYPLLSIFKDFKCLTINLELNCDKTNKWKILTN